MEKSIKRYIIITSILIVTILAIIVIINLKRIDDEKQAIDYEYQEAEKVKVEDVEPEKDTYIYVYSNDVINKVFNYISETEKNVKNAEALVNILDKDFIQKNNITEENVLSILKDYKDISSYFSKEIYRREISHRQDISGCYYYIKGIARKNGEEKYVYILMKQDLGNSTYSITIMNLNEYNEKKIGENEEIHIEKNLYNEIYSKRVSDHEICLEFFNDYINTIKNNPEKGYSLLDEQYKQKKFEGLNDYLKYINAVKNRMSNAVLVNYKVQEGENSKQYICIDQTGNYYIFEHSTLMDYDVILDTYTIDLPILTERYTNANVIVKGNYNIERCFEAINNKDYIYVYDKLNEAFKNNNYKTLGELESTLNNKLFDSNTAEITYKINEGNIYIYEVKVSDSEDSTKNINMEIIMQLKDDNNFEMSFSFKK